jgi:hypothetical protein
MGKIDIKTKVSDKVSALWRGFIKKSPVFIVLTSLTVVSVLGLGVGGTLAATGVIPNPFASSASVESSPETETDDSGQGPAPIGDGTLPSDVGEWKALGCDFSQKDCQEESYRRGNVIRDSGWTGVTYNFSESGLSLWWQVRISTFEEVRMMFQINGHLVSSSLSPCHPGNAGLCAGGLNNPLINNMDSPSLTWCKPGGDVYLIEVAGGNVNFRETGIIPAGVIDCPTPSATTSPTPESSSEPTTSPTPESSSEPTTSPTPESSPTPDSSSEPESSPTPTP